MLTNIPEIDEFTILAAGFREHPTHKGYYANDRGDVWSDPKGRLLRGHDRLDGYNTLNPGMKKGYVYRHVFVFECFHGLEKAIKGVHHVDHIDGNKGNNTLSNLQELTIADHARKTVASHNPESSTRWKPVRRYRLDEGGKRTDVMEYSSAKHAAEAVMRDGLSFESVHRSISTAVRGDQKTAYSYFWEDAQEDLPGEVWCSLRAPEFFRVQVSSMGRIRTSKGTKTFGFKTSMGYYRVHIKKKGYLVHRLVALAFHGSPPSDAHTTVDHIDEDKGNNCADNLMWATMQMQVDRSCSKPVIAYTSDGVEVGRWPSASSAAREMGTLSTNLLACISGRYETHNGLIWKLA